MILPIDTIGNISIYSLNKNLVLLNKKNYDVVIPREQNFYRPKYLNFMKSIGLADIALNENNKYLWKYELDRIKKYYSWGEFELNSDELYLIFAGQLPKEVGNMINLKILSCNSCYSKYIPHEISKLVYLRHLNFSSSDVPFDDIICELYNLRILRMDNNNITIIPPNIKNLKYLEKLELSRNQIKIIPEEICQLFNLQSIILYDNQIESIPNKIGNLVNLQFLGLGNNYIKYIPKQIGNLLNLETIYIYGNDIEELPVELSSLTKLIVLNCPGNKIKVLPAEFKNIQNIKITI